jgi:hypothetical protein
MKPFTLLLLLLIAAPALAQEPTWSPQPTERLVKLPAEYLKKTIDRDFAESQLGVALQGTEEEVGLKANTLAELKEASDKTGGPMRDDIRRQFLGEKRAYVELMSKKNGLKRKELDTRRRLYERMLRDVDLAEGADNPQRRALVDAQDAARKRFEASVDAVDLRLFDSGDRGQSRYAETYAANRHAIEQLLDRIKAHRLSVASTLEGDDGKPLGRKDQIRRLLAESQGELALLDQEDVMLGYMARLVSLDAMDLADEGAARDGPGGARLPARPADAVGLFLPD